jgi:predicted Zn finger-like uncharacterized protein
MIITCPHCQTKYQVTYEAIGATGRKVQCAQCQQAWRQDPVVEPEPVIIDPLTEDGLDEAMEAEAREANGEGPGKPRPAVVGAVDPAVIRERQRNFTRRQSAINKRLPLARLRRTVRVLGVAALAGVAVLAIWARVAIVERYPAMAGIYSAVGLPVNVVGLDFADVETLRTLRDGKEVLLVSAKLIGLRGKPVAVPPVVVTLLDGTGAGIYEWSVAASTPTLKAGEHAVLETQLGVPPAAAERVRLSFAGGAPSQNEPPQVAAAPADHHPVAASAPAHEVEQH